MHVSATTTDKSLVRVRPLNQHSEAEISLVAERMWLTLVEVEGEANAQMLHSLSWLRERVLWHVHETDTIARVFLAETSTGEIVGHTIVRKEVAQDNRDYGLFSTTYVAPEYRRHQIASQLLEAGEEWFLQNHLACMATWTSSTNVKLISLYERRGYAIAESGNNPVTNTLMVKLSKTVREARVEA
jgi:GNAT superfamily N-acetyltransferase